MPSADPALLAAINAVPAGTWAVGVSGGADSVALLTLLRGRADLRLTVLHVNHEARGAASDADEQFVTALACRLGVDFVAGHWHGIEPMLADAPTNRSARFRAGRMAFFRHVVKLDRLQGVILAHHADDVAETVLQRLLRGGGIRGLTPLRRRSTVGGLLVLRPLLRVRRETLRRSLVERGQEWREDDSNVSPRYQRNRLRAILAKHSGLTDALLELPRASGVYRSWIRRHTPEAPPRLATSLLNGLPAPLALEAASRWLAARGAPPGELSATVLHRLQDMVADAASPARQHFPGGLLVRRTSGWLYVDGDARNPPAS